MGDNMPKRKKYRLKIKNTIIFLILLSILIFIIFKAVTHNDFVVTLNHDVYYIGETYNNDFKATYKGKDVTDKVKVTHNIYNNEIGTYQIDFIYTLDNKEFKTTKQIKIEDNIDPVITLKSSSLMMLVKDTTYKEPGYSALDSYDGDLTKEVKVSGNVDTSKEGEYIIKYTVTDSSGNKAIEKRKVIVTTNSPLTMSLKDYSLEGFFTDVQLKKTEQASKEYMDNTIFAGDSTALYYVMNKIITGKQLWHKEGVSLETIFTQNIYINHVDSKLTLIDAVKNKKPSRILLMLGTNSVSTMEVEYFIQKYEELLKRLKEVSPNTTIIVQSIFPVASSLDSSGKALNNDKINKMNYYLLELCSKLDIPFLNTAEALKGEDGTLKSGYYRTTKNENGVHLAQEGNQVAIEYFNNHVYEN